MSELTCLDADGQASSSRAHDLRYVGTSASHFCLKDWQRRSREPFDVLSQWGTKVREAMITDLVIS
jgi:hypothetical protein